jgi:transcriptional regulator with XRE-family HTH domain
MVHPLEDRPVELPSKTFARQLQAARKQAGLTQTALAERVNDLGGSLHATAITRIERGTRAASVDDVALLARALRVSPVYLMFPINDDVAVKFTPTEPVCHEPARVRMWARGELPLLVDRAAQYGTQSSPPQWGYDRSFFAWVPFEDVVVWTTRASSTCSALLATLKAVILQSEGRLDIDDPRAELGRLRRLFRTATEEIEDYIVDRERAEADQSAP